MTWMLLSVPSRLVLLLVFFRLTLTSSRVFACVMFETWSGDRSMSMGSLLILYKES